MLRIPFYQHDLGEEELRAISDVFQGEILTTGTYVAQFERVFADYLGCNHALGVTSCTGALHLALLGMDIGPGDEVITTPMSFIATATAIIETGATPVFVDVEPNTGNMDASLIEAAITPRTKAILPVHLYGLMCDMKAIRSIADRHGLKIIEDCAHCVEAIRDGIRPGELSDAACFSFYATKNLTCGEGGALATNDTELFERLKLLRIHGMDKLAAERARDGDIHWDMKVLGWKYNMSNIEAAILLPQFSRLEEKLKSRTKLSQYYREALDGHKDIRMPAANAGESCTHAHHLFSIWLPAERRDSVLSALRDRGVGFAVNYRAIHVITYFKETYGYVPDDFPNANKIGNETSSLPFYPGMPYEHVDLVCEHLFNIL